MDLFNSNLIIREWLNGSLTPVSFNLTAILAFFLLQSYWEGRALGIPWTRLPGVTTGCTLFWIFGADTIRAGWVWVILRTANNGLPISPWIEWLSNVSFFTAGIMLILAMLRCTYIWAPPKIRRAYLIYSIATTLLFLLLSHLLPAWSFRYGF